MVYVVHFVKILVVIISEINHQALELYIAKYAATYCKVRSYVSSMTICSQLVYYVTINFLVRRLLVYLPC